MDSLAYQLLKQKLMIKKENEFQAAIDTIFGIIYEKSFTAIKQKRDKGTDGFLNSTISLAIFAPEKYKLADFKRKISGDYQKYKANWSASYPIWNVITNLENTGEMISHVKSLDPNAELISVVSLCDMIRNQSWGKIAKIFKALDLPEAYLSYDIFTMIIDDISNINDSHEAYDTPLYIKEKVALNIQDQNQRNNFIDEYESYLIDFPTIQKVLGSFETIKVDALRAKVRSAFQIVSGDFLQKFAATALNLSGSRSVDDFYCLHVRKILFYLFEQCLIGIKAKKETENV